MKLYLKTKLNKEQKEAIGLLSVGTFLEYFDLMLYVHMAVVLNELFFPKTDPFTASLITAFSFCSIFVFRPFGALVFGYIGDNVGRKVTVVITTFLMSISCVIMATLPTYAQVGITASWIITICRIVQGMSSMGEIVGAEIYLTETVKPPLQYPVVMIIAIASILGGVFALALASLFSSYGFNWRYAFWIGAVIALVGAIARTTLREAVDFADAKRRVQITLNNELTKEALANNYLYNKKNNKITLLSLFFIQCGWPICFYFTYIYCGNFLKQNLGFTSDQVIHQNFIISIIALIGYIIITFLSYRVHPLKILQFKLWVFCPFAFITPYLLSNIDNYLQLFFIQTFFVLFVLSTNPATPVFYNHISIFKRFTSGSFIYALSRAIMHITTSFGLVYLEKYFGYLGIVVIFVPMCMGFAFGLFHFKKLEIEAGNYYH